MRKTALIIFGLVALTLPAGCGRTPVAGPEDVRPSPAAGDAQALPDDPSPPPLHTP